MTVNKIQEFFNNISDEDLEQAIKEIYDLEQTGIMINSIIRNKFIPELEKVVEFTVWHNPTDLISNVLRQYAYRKMGLIK